jgi:FixJ family two-component response regulator
MQRSRNWCWLQPVLTSGLLVTDVELGGEMSGVELAQYAKRKFPDLNVVMVSGHGPPHVPHDTHFLMKPYEPQQLLDAVLR